ncbi:helix-turn-helix domain-containing protein [Roseivivax sp. THAF30]|jgi:DNA-binding HxlR family transcriptional regulator|uniref:winged helix-turn-helix transcriptional regulator n=1 Tax=Roseivivax sp. THAF30 TaxID=2587852 RepID=UPI001268AD29|nr:helix-turn-helix domain-containing protein [Roseivivax sp. THAF30]QFT61306.1 putative HTH-type transcriptional regulator YybR [Roseivivax sp. THAF30]
MRLGHLEVPGDCHEISPILSRVGNKWSALVVLVLTERPKRFNELRREIESISQKMLTTTLRALEEDGLVVRTVKPTTPPQVEYALTHLGESLVEPLFALCDWSARNLETIAKNRAAFAKRQS